MSSAVPQGPRAVNPTDEKTRGYREISEIWPGRVSNTWIFHMGVSKN